MPDTGKKNCAKGMLYLCATPIGNMKDITLRALECLKEADLVAAENAERSRKLLIHYGIKATLLTYRESNRKRAGREILSRVREGYRVVLLSDAGMPAISDPGYHLVKLALEENIPFTVLPGPSAALTALLLSGYPARRFVFWGYLSRKKGELRKELKSIAAEEKTVIIFEAPHRLLTTLQEMEKLFPEREIAVCRELTKKFEEVRRGTASELLEHYRQTPPRGEFTLVLSPLQENVFDSPAREEVENLLREALGQNMQPAEAVKEVARALSLPKNKVYALMLNILRERDGV